MTYEGFEPPASRMSSERSTTEPISLVPSTGFEPVTLRFSDGCSTTELQRLVPRVGFEPTQSLRSKRSAFANLTTGAGAIGGIRTPDILVGNETV